MEPLSKFHIDKKLRLPDTDTLDIDHPFADKPSKKACEGESESEKSPQDQTPKIIKVGSVDDEEAEEDEDENAGYMEQEEIVIKKGKKLKQVKQIKLREYNI